MPGVGTTPVGNIALGASANSAQYIASQKVHREQINPVDLGMNAFVGGFAGWASGPIPGPKDTLFGEPLLINGKTSMAGAVQSELRNLQVGSAVSNTGFARATTGATATNVDWQEIYNLIE